MNKNNHYRLYLKNSENSSTFYISGLLYGKIPLDKKEKVFYKEIPITNLKEIIEELRENP